MVAGAFIVELKARASLTDCLVVGNVAADDSGAFNIQGAASVSILRTTFDNNRVHSGYGGCFSVFAGSSLTIEDSQILNCWAGEHSGMVYLAGTMTITGSRMAGNGAAGRSGLADLPESDSFLRIAGSTITDTYSGVGEFAIDAVIQVPHFAILLDTVVVDGSLDIFSHSKVLIQNCDGFNSTAVQNASVGTCESTSDYCLAESCADERVGIDCICDVDGVPNPFPTDCMQSAVIKARRFLS